MERRMVETKLCQGSVLANETLESSQTVTLCCAWESWEIAPKASKPSW